MILKPDRFPELTSATLDLLEHRGKRLPAREVIERQTQFLLLGRIFIRAADPSSKGGAGLRPANSPVQDWRYLPAPDHRLQRRFVAQRFGLEWRPPPQHGPTGENPDSLSSTCLSHPCDRCDPWSRSPHNGHHSASTEFASGHWRRAPSRSMLRRRSDIPSAAHSITTQLIETQRDHGNKHDPTAPRAPGDA